MKRSVLARVRFAERRRQLGWDVTTVLDDLRWLALGMDTTLISFRAPAALAEMMVIESLDVPVAEFAARLGLTPNQVVEAVLARTSAG